MAFLWGDSVLSVERNSSKGDMSLKYVDQTLSASGEILLFPLDLLLGLKTSRHNPHLFWRSHRQKKSLGKAVVQFPCKTVKRLKTTEATPKKGGFFAVFWGDLGALVSLHVQNQPHSLS